MFQIVAYANMASKAQNLNISLGFSNLTQPIIGTVTMLNVILITSAVALALLIIFVYIIPLRIAVDSENPLKWYYPCVCGCRGRRMNKVTEPDQDQTNESQDPLLMRPSIRTIGASTYSADLRTSNGSYSPAQNSNNMS